MAREEYKDRIGLRHSDHIEWPKLDVNGNPYTRPPVAIAKVGRMRFVVLPIGFVDYDGVLARMRLEYAIPGSIQPIDPETAPGKSKRQIADEAGE